MVFLILIGAHIFSPFLAMSRIPVDLANALTGMALPPLAVLAVILVAYIILGMFLEGFAILVLTVPIVLPDHARARLRPDLVRDLHGDRARDGAHQPAGRASTSSS